MDQGTRRAVVWVAAVLCCGSIAPAVGFRTFHDKRSSLSLKAEFYSAHAVVGMVQAGNSDCPQYPSWTASPTPVLHLGCLQRESCGGVRLPLPETTGVENTEQMAPVLAGVTGFGQEQACARPRRPYEVALLYSDPSE